MTAPALFGEPPRVLPDLLPASASADRRRTARQRADVRSGRHPLTRGRARPELGTCGDCRHRVLAYGPTTMRPYPKCDQGLEPGQPLGRAPYYSRGVATDVRAWWPACDSHERRP